MGRKITEYIISHPARCLVFFIIFLISFTIIISMLPSIVVESIAVCLLFIMFITAIIFFCKDKKARQKVQNMEKLDYEKKWELYVKLVDEMISAKKYERNNLDNDWIEVFNELIDSVATNPYLLRRKFNDFDIAACLLYSLTWTSDTDENILMAFDCAKHLIDEPKEYFRHLGYGNELELEVEKTFEKVNLHIPNEIITDEVIVSIIRTYLTQKTVNGILQLSDFLHILYLYK